MVDPNVDGAVIQPPFILVLLAAYPLMAAEPAGRWSAEKANAWYRAQPWLVGCNFAPSTAINQLEMWQADTFDLKTIDRELGWAEGLGFNSIRVFLHHLLWEQDREGFLKRMDEFLAVADKHGIGVIERFKNDKRVQVWDLYNEPGNPNRSAYGDKELPDKEELSLRLLRRVFSWARQVNPSQPLTSGVWIGTWPDPEKLRPIEQCQLGDSDVISFHSYGDLDATKKCVQNLRRYNRPILCTEYMARPRGSTFDPILGWFKEEKMGAYNWGFVSGKSQTIYPWASWQKTYTAEPPLWFHDIFRPNGTPYIAEEVRYICSVTGAPKKP